MTKEQMEILIAMHMGQCTAMVHLGRLFSELANMDKEVVAKSFKATADLIGDNVKNKEIIAMVLNQIATGIETSGKSGDEQMEQIRKLLH
ncbi:hypothetical protein ACY3SZ_004041 [Yersinia enterocolitica]